jgi:hypothetical protein
MHFVAESNFISIRDVGKILSATALLPSEVQAKDIYAGWRIVIVTLVISRVVRPEVFRKLIAGSARSEEIAALFGVTDANIIETIEGKRNTRYTHERFLLYHLWQFLMRDGILDDEELSKHISRMFDTFGSVRSAKTIPARAYEDYLSVFEISE